MSLLLLFCHVHDFWKRFEPQWHQEMLAKEPDIEVVGEAKDLIDVLLSAGNTLADIVVISLPPNKREPGLPSHLLAEYPQLKVIGVSPEWDSIVVYSMGIIREELPIASTQAFACLIKEIAARSA